jgi:DNA-binding Lrp family transcriptional regulator
MDALDRRILALLSEDGRRSYESIGRQVSLSAPAVKRRVDALRASGTLRGFTAVIDHAALGSRTEALIELFYAPGTLLTRSKTSLARHPEVVEAWSVTGEAGRDRARPDARQRRPRADHHGPPARGNRRPRPGRTSS